MCSRGLLFDAPTAGGDAAVCFLHGFFKEELGHGRIVQHRCQFEGGGKKEGIKQRRVMLMLLC